MSFREGFRKVVISKLSTGFQIVLGLVGALWVGFLGACSGHLRDYCQTTPCCYTTGDDINPALPIIIKNIPQFP